MALTRAHILAALVIAAGGASAQPAIEAFTSVCFRAGLTAADAQARMQAAVGTPLPFETVFWDKTLEDAPQSPAHSERRCEVVMQGDYAQLAVEAVLDKMATPPVFGTPLPLPAPFAAREGTALIEARALLRGRVAVVHIGVRDAGTRTFIRVDRLPTGQGLDG